jgi:hypothetical protein
MSKDTGGSAFPVPELKNRHDEVCQYAETGMTLRDYFAAKAMASEIIAQNGMEGTDVAHITGMAYEFAEYMLKARND